MSQQAFFILIGLCGGTAIWLLHRFGLYADSRGWIYYRKRADSAGGGGVVRGMLELERFLTPSAVHRTEVQETTVKTVRSNVPDNDHERPGVFLPPDSSRNPSDEHAGGADA